jgi:hypothetical protein
MGDDIVTIGGPERGAGRGPGETIESLFAAQYARTMCMAFDKVGDWDVAERVTERAFLRLSGWWRWRLTPDSDAAVRFLEEAVAEVAGAAASGAGAGSQASGRSGAGAGSQAGGRSGGGAGTEGGGAGSAVDPARPAGDRELDPEQAWLRFVEFQSIARRTTFLRLATGAATAAAVAAVVTALMTFGGTGRHAALPVTRQQGSRPLLVGVYPSAVVAQLPLTGVVSVVGDKSHVWVVRRATRGRAGNSYQLVEIDPRTNRMTLRASLGSQRPAVVLGGGALWLTTPFGGQLGQVDQVDPATGRVVGALHLPGGSCKFLAYSAGHLYAGCQSSGSSGSGATQGVTEFIRIDPSSGRLRGHADLVGIPRVITASPSGVWFTGLSGINALTGAPFGSQSIAVSPTYYRPSLAPYRPSLTRISSLDYSAGFVWALTSNEHVARINPATGRVVRVYRLASDGGKTRAMAPGLGSMWLMVDGPGFSNVLRVDEDTGFPLGRVPMQPEICYLQSCSQIYFAAGAIWVPTPDGLTRINPALVPSRPQYSPPLQRDPPRRKVTDTRCGRPIRRACQ